MLSGCKMSLLIPMLILFMMFYIAIGYRNRYTYFMILSLFSIIGILYATFLLIYKTGYYFRLNGLLGDIDGQFFLNISKVKLSTYSIIRIYNISVAMFLLSSVCYILLYINDIKMIVMNKYKAKICSIFLFPIWYSLFYDPKITYYIYIKIFEHKFLKNIINFIDLLNYLVIICYILLPLVLVIFGIRHKKMYIAKKQLIYIAMSISMLEILFAISLCAGVYRVPYFMDSSILSVKYVDMNFGKRTAAVFTLVTVILTFILYYMISKNNITSKIGFVKQYIFRKNLRSINKNYIHAMHSVKNVIFSYKIMIESALGEAGAKREESLLRLENKMTQYIDNISLMLNLEDANIEVECEKITYDELVERTLEKANIQDEIKVIKNLDTDLEICVDVLYMTEALANIVNNAVDAIQRSGREFGQITFENDVDGEWSVLKVTDNGIGMTRKNMSNLFKPFYTTKSRMTNWGMGLPFAYKIITMNCGYISVTSEFGKGTTFYIYLPLKNE